MGISLMDALKKIVTEISVWANGKLDNKVDKIDGKGLSTNDYTTIEKNTLSDLKTKVGNSSVSEQITSAINNITPESIGAAPVHSHNYAEATHSHKKLDITDFPTSMPASDVSDWAKASTKPTYTYDEVGAAAESHGAHVTYSTTVPVMDGDASVGTASTVARSDHKHPTDTSRASASDLTALSNLVGNTAVSTQISNMIGMTKYASSSSAGGSATSAVKLDTAIAGSETQPVYFVNGKPSACTYTLGKSVPSNAVFTDTIYTHPTHTARSSGLYNITVDDSGHVSAATAVDKSDITALGIPAQDTVYTLPTATSSVLGGVKVGSNITNSSGTISLTKTNVTDALGYTPTHGEDISDAINTLSSDMEDIKEHLREDIENMAEDLRDEMGSIKYAASSVVGGSAISAVKLDTTIAGSATQPVYFTDGKPSPCTYTLGKSVPSDAVFTDTTYTAGSGIIFDQYNNNAIINTGVISVGTGSTNGTISVRTGDTTANVGVKGLGSAAYTASTAYDPSGSASSALTNAKSYIDTKVTDYLPLSGGTITGNLTINNSTYFKSSCYMPNGVMYNAYDSTGTACCLLGLNSSNNLLLGSTSYPHSGDTIIRSPKGTIQFTNSVGSLIFNTASGNGYNCVFRPIDENTKPLLGSTSYPWHKVYANTTTIQTSDEREKSNIMDIADYPVTYSGDGSGNVFEKLFKKLTPKTYTLNSEDTDELHIGFVAQDVEKALEELGLTVDDVSIVEHNYWTDEETGEEKDKYGLAYAEFIALNTYIIQKQQDEIEFLKERVVNLEGLINK